MKKTLIKIYKLVKEIREIEWLLISIGIILSILLLIISFKNLINLAFEKKPKYGGIYREGIYQKINSINPFLAQNQSELAIVNLIYDSLIRPDGKGGYEYEIAKNIIPIEKGLGYEVELKNLYWSNGAKITSDDVITTFSIIKSYTSGELFNYFKDVKIEKIDNYKIKFILPTKDNLFLQKLSFVKIIPSKEWVKYPPSEWQNNEENIIKVSSGPFIFYKKYKIKNDINVFEFKRNEYYNPKPYLDKIIIYEYPDIKTAYEALKIKEIDGIGGLSFDYLDSVSKRSFKVEKIILPRVIALFFNSKKVKEDIAKKLDLSLNRNELVKEVFGDTAEPSYSIFSPSIKKLWNLKEENLEVLQNTSTNPTNINFSEITITVPDNFYLLKIGNYLQKKFGFKIKSESSFNIINQIIPNKDFESLIFGISYKLIPDLLSFFAKDSILHLTGIDSTEIIKKIQDFNSGDLNNFSKYLEEIEKNIKNKEPIVFIANNFYIYILPKNLKGFDLKYLNEPSERFIKVENWYIYEKTIF